MLHVLTVVVAYAPALRPRPIAVRGRSCVVASSAATARLDSLLSSGDLSSALALLSSDEPLDLTPARTAMVVDAACKGQEPAVEMRLDPASGGLAGLLERIGEEPEELAERKRAIQAEDEQQQEVLLACYTSLSRRGALRGFGSANGALPAPTPKVVTTDEQQRLTGLPTTAFAPGKRGGGDFVAGLATAIGLVAASSYFGLPVPATFQATAGALLLDRLLLQGALVEAVARLVRPAYARTVLQHEAGHFLVAYLLGCPIQACLLDTWQARRDGRFAGTAGTVFFDPELSSAMKRGELPRSAVDRYSVVVLAGIASEAQQNGRAEGGQADEAALVRLLGSLDGGRSWDLPRIQNQARWGASQALLLLREHEAAFAALCAALERGASVGECMVAIETALGQMAELPTARRRAQAATEAEAAAATEERRIAKARADTAAQAQGTLSAEEQAARQREVKDRLAQIDDRLSELK